MLLKKFKEIKLKETEKEKDNAVMFQEYATNLPKVENNENDSPTKLMSLTKVLIGSFR